MRIHPSAWLLACLLFASPASAQLTVEVVLDQEQYLRDEPLPARVKITNRSGQTLRFGRDNQWLSLVVENIDAAVTGVVPRLTETPVIGEFDLDSAQVATREVDLTPVFDLSQAGRYQVTATVKIKEWDRELTSRPRAFEIVRGTKLWEQEFGIPRENGAPESRRYILQQASYRKQLRLYLRVADASDQHVFNVFSCGPIVSFSAPEAQVDRSGFLNVLFQTGARSFLFYFISPEGRIALRQSYDYAATRPTLRANDDGRVFVAGGVRRLSTTDLPPPLSTTYTNAPAATNTGTAKDRSTATPKASSSKNAPNNRK